MSATPNYGNNQAGFYMPLSSSSLSHGVVGPSHCVFSSPKVTYSQNTQTLVNLLAKESKLTHSQRNGFQSILRSGNSLPMKWDDAVARRRDYNMRRVAHGRELGLNLNQEYAYGRNYSGPNHLILPGSRRSLESIKASGVLEIEKYARNYVPKNVEQEKARFAYKMAYGKNPGPNTNPASLSPIPGRQKRLQPSIDQLNDEKPIEQIKRERFHELVAEIQERVDFMGSMQKMSRDKSYRSYIIFQLKEKVDEMRKLCPSEAEAVLERLQLHRVDAAFVDF